MTTTRVNPFRAAGIRDGLAGAPRYTSLPYDEQPTVADPLRHYREGYQAGASLRYVREWRRDRSHIPIDGAD